MIKLIIKYLLCMESGIPNSSLLSQVKRLLLENRLRPVKQGYCFLNHRRLLGQFLFYYLDLLFLLLVEVLLRLDHVQVLVPMQGLLKDPKIEELHSLQRETHNLVC